jgi:hypothetical protein
VAASRTPVAGVAEAGVPDFAHIYLIVMENHEYGSIVGNGDAPYLNGLIHDSGLATNFHAVGHPSEPNYLALFAGSTFGIGDDGVHDLPDPNLADQLEAHGRTWAVYAQDLPGRCSTVAAARGGVDLIGQLHRHLGNVALRSDHRPLGLRSGRGELRADRAEHDQRHARRDRGPG